MPCTANDNNSLSASKIGQEQRPPDFAWDRQKFVRNAVIAGIARQYTLTRPLSAGTFRP